jgi:hypothetical protein
VLSHITLMLTVLEIWDNGDIFTVVWSSLQFILSCYSYCLTFGTIPVKIVLLYIKQYIRAILFILISVSTTLVTVSLGLWLTSSMITTSVDPTQQFLYTLYSNAPELVFLWPFVFFLENIDNYISDNYGYLINQTSTLAFISDYINGKINI